jgi:hypothetical protein
VEAATEAEPLEAQLSDWLKDFRPDEELRAYVLASLRGAARRSDDVAVRRRELIRQLNRLRDLYVMEDLSKSEYLVRRQAIEEQLERTGMPLDPRDGGRRAASAGDFRVRVGCRPAGRLPSRHVLREWCLAGASTRVRADLGANG